MSLKDRLKRDYLRAPRNQGILAFVKRKLKPRKKIRDRYLSLFLNRYCNLNCFSCAALGMNPPKAETKFEDISNFIKNLNGYRKGSTIMLTGGESTLVKPSKIKKICDLFHENGYKVSILTNGAVKLPPEWFDFILLDRHGVNDNEIDSWIPILEKCSTPYDIHEKQEHQDIRYAMEGNISKGARCNNWLNPLTLWKNAIYPCCNLMCVEWWRDDTTLYQDLEIAGWSADNPDLKETIINWRETLPASVYRICQIGCWKDADKARWEPIACADDFATKEDA